MKIRQHNREQVMRLKRHYIMTTLLIGLLFSLSACATMNEASSKFTKTKSADVAYFADTTIALVGDADFGLTRDDAIYTREFFDREGAEEKALMALLAETKFLLKAIVDYSIKIVTIAETEKSETGRVKRYADHLDTLDDWVEGHLELGDAHYKDVVTTVRKQEKFLDALNQAQPVVNAFGRYAELLIEEIDTATEKLVWKMDAKIDDKFKGVIVYHEELRKEKYAVLDALKSCYLVYRGDKGAIQKLQNTYTIREQKLIEKLRPDDKAALREVSQHLKTRLDGLDRIEKEIQVDWDTYRATHSELDRKHAELDASRNRARLLFLVWIRAHGKMASGRVKPAEWFDISDVPKDLLRTGTKLIF